MRRCVALALAAWTAAAAAFVPAAPTDPPLPHGMTEQLTPAGFLDFAEFQPLRRAVNCPADYFSCEDRGSAFLGVCCRTGQLCALDGSQQAACCPQGNFCTGVAPGGSTATTASYVSNTYFPFPYAPTSFPNAGACSAALSQCSANYQACTADLLGVNNGWGVTIAVPGGGGITVAPTHPVVPPATATSVCQSLSNEACHGLQSTQCTQTGTHGGFIVGTQNAASHPTAACMAGVIAGVGLGILGGHF